MLWLLLLLQFEKRNDAQLQHGGQREEEIEKEKRGMVQKRSQSLNEATVILL